MVVTVLAAAWAAIAASPFVVVARRTEVAVRAGGLRRSREARRAPARLPAPLATVVAVGRAPLRRRARRANDDALRRELPVVIDLLAVAVGAGCTPFGAVEVAAAWCPPTTAPALQGVLGACDLGASIGDALERAGAGTPTIAPVTDALRAAAELGTPIAPALARLATEARADLRRTAEQRARTVPVRLLFPLVFLVLPAFTLLTVAPVLLDGFAGR